MEAAGLAVVLLGISGDGDDGEVIVLNPLDGTTQFFRVWMSLISIMAGWTTLLPRVLSMLARITSNKH